jgi:hypothetical protein
MKATATRPAKQARKPVARFIRPISRDSYRITVGKAWDDYEILAIPSDFGAAFSVSALTVLREAPMYHVCVTGPGVATCDCIAGSKGTRCKHRDGVLKLIDLGKLSAAGVRDDGPEREYDFREDAESRTEPETMANSEFDAVMNSLRATARKAYAA